MNRHIQSITQPIITLGATAIVCGLVALILFIGLLPTIDVLKECESRGWDGSEYNTGVKNYDIGENYGQDILVKCNKEENETDAMIDLVESIPFIDIREPHN